MAVRPSTGYAAAILGPTSWDTIFLNGCLEVYSGDAPVDGDQAVIGTLLGRVTRDGGVFTPGSPANGLQFMRNGRYVAKHPAHLWRLTGIATGTAGWCRLRANAFDDGLVNITAPRVDGNCGLIGSLTDTQLWLPTLDITPETNIDIGQWWYAIPPLPGA